MPKETVRNVAFVVLGALGFVLKRYYGGPAEGFVDSYAGNFFVSFGFYFVVLTGCLWFGAGRLTAALVTLIVLEGIEVTNGLGLMSSGFDAYDLLANAVGVAVAYLVDLATSSKSGP